MTAKQPTPQGISALLKRAGFERSNGDSSALTTGYHAYISWQRNILDPDAADSAIESKPSTNKGPFGDVHASLNRLAKGQPLPTAEELRGGSR